MHDKKVLKENEASPVVPLCNFRDKTFFLLDGKCQQPNIIYDLKCHHRKLQVRIPITMDLQKMLLNAGYTNMKTLSNTVVREILQSRNPTSCRNKRKSN